MRSILYMRPQRERTSERFVSTIERAYALHWSFLAGGNISDIRRCYNNFGIRAGAPKDYFCICNIQRPKEHRHHKTLMGFKYCLAVGFVRINNSFLAISFRHELVFQTIKPMFRLRKAGAKTLLCLHLAVDASATAEDMMRYECVIGALAARIALTEQYFVVESSMARSMSSDLRSSP